MDVREETRIASKLLLALQRRKIDRREFLLLTAGLSGAAFLAACKSSISGGQQSGATGSTTLVIAQGFLPAAWDPALDASLASSATYSYLFDKLIHVDAKGNVIPHLATSWTNPTPATWQFKLRSGVTFHNGEVFDSAAAKYSIERIQDPATKSPWRSKVAPITSISAPDSSTLVLKTAQPFSGLHQALTNVFMVPPKYTAQAGVGGFGKAPVGSGPFKFTSFQVNSNVVLDRNPNYFLGAPKLKQVTINSVPDEAARIAALKSGEAQVVFPVSPDQAVGLASDSRFKVPTLNLGQSEVVLFRTTSSGPIGNKTVRQALSYAVDRQTIAKTLMRDRVRLLDGQLIGPEGFGYNPDVKAFPYDPQKAKQMLASAGYSDGFSVQFQGPQARFPNDVQVGQAIADSFSQVGVKTSYQVLEAAAFSASFANKTWYPISLQAWNTAPAMSVDAPYQQQLSNGPYDVLKNTQFDSMYAQEAAELDPNKRKVLLRQMAVYFKELAACIPLWEIPVGIGIDAKVSGFKANPDYTLDLLHILGP